MLLSKLKPAVYNHWLIAIAGLSWSIVGLILCRMAYQWLINPTWIYGVSFGMIGISLSLIIHYFAFSRIAKKNIERICQSSDRKCLFAFQAWKSYIIIAVMITLGIILRHSLFPKHYLAIVYSIIGVALILSSFEYYIQLWRLLRYRNPCRVSD